MYRHTDGFLSLEEDKKELFDQIYEASYILVEFQRETNATFKYIKEVFQDKNLENEVMSRNSYLHYINHCILGQMRKSNCFFNLFPIF